MGVHGSCRCLQGRCRRLQGQSYRGLASWGEGGVSGEHAAGQLLSKGCQTGGLQHHRHQVDIVPTSFLQNLAEMVVVKLRLYLLDISIPCLLRCFRSVCRISRTKERLHPTVRRFVAV